MQSQLFLNGQNGRELHCGVCACRIGTMARLLPARGPPWGSGPKGEEMRAMLLLKELRPWRRAELLLEWTEGSVKAVSSFKDM